MLTMKAGRVAEIFQPTSRDAKRKKQEMVGRSAGPGRFKIGN